MFFSASLVICLWASIRHLLVPEPLTLVDVDDHFIADTVGDRRATADHRYQGQP